jgi:hypothetical protein
MSKNLFEKWSAALQARLGTWLTEIFCDVYDVACYESWIHVLLCEADIHYETYAPHPWFNYQDAIRETWKVFVLFQGEWNQVTLPNPLYTRHEKNILSTLKTSSVEI